GVFQGVRDAAFGTGIVARRRGDVLPRSGEISDFLPQPMEGDRPGFSPDLEGRVALRLDQEVAGRAVPVQVGEDEAVDLRAPEGRLSAGQAAVELVAEPLHIVQL